MHTRQPAESTFLTSRACRFVVFASLRRPWRATRTSVHTAWTRSLHCAPKRHQRTPSRPKRREERAPRQPIYSQTPKGERERERGMLLEGERRERTTRPDKPDGDLGDRTGPGVECGTPLLRLRFRPAPLQLYTGTMTAMKE